MSTGDVRVRRPREREVLLQQLRDEAGFPTFRDALLFAAALGSAHNAREGFETSAEQIRYEILSDPPFAESLVLMLAACSAPEDPEIIGSNRLDEAVRIFEEYANGGLGIIQGEINNTHESAEQVCLRLVTTALHASGDKPRESIDALADELTW